MVRLGLDYSDLNAEISECFQKSNQTTLELFTSFLEVVDGHRRESYRSGSDPGWGNGHGYHYR